MIEANENIATNRQVAVLVIFIVICFMAAGLGSMATTPKLPNWYANLAKPAWTPPGWVFGPVWTLLYLMMAFAAWLIWRKVGFGSGIVPLTVFAIQLLLNSLWSFIFFGLQKPGYAAMEITVLWLAIIATMISFWRCFFVGWSNVDSLLAMGEFRGSPELLNMAYEPLVVRISRFTPR